MSDDDMRCDGNVMHQPGEQGMFFSVTEGSSEEMSAQASFRFPSFAPKHHLPLVATHHSICFSRLALMLEESAMQCDIIT